MLEIYPHLPSPFPFSSSKKRGCVKTLAQPLLYFTVLLYFLLAMLLFPHAFGNKLLYSNYIGL